jgi:hypothetical protein
MAGADGVRPAGGLWPVLPLGRDRRRQPAPEGEKAPPGEAEDSTGPAGTDRDGPGRDAPRVDEYA